MSAKITPGHNARAIRSTTSLGGVEVAKNAQVTVIEHGDDTAWFTARLEASHLILPVGDFEPVEPPEPFATPAPLDPALVKAGDTVTLTKGETSVRGPVTGISYAGGGEWDFRVGEESYRRTGRIGLWAVTSHQPAPEPEYVDTLSAVIFEEIGKSPDDHALAADLAAAAVRERFVAIDLTGLRERLADVARAKFGGPTDAWFDFADATLAELGLEVAPTTDVAPEPGPEWKPGTIGTAGTVRGLGYTGPVVRTDEHLLPWWTPSRVDGAHYHGEETVTDFVPDEPKVPNGVVIDPAAVDWRGLQSQMSVLVVGAEPFKRAGDILAVVRRELGIEATS